MWFFDFLIPKNSHSDIISHNTIPDIQSLQNIKTKIINNTALALSNKCIRAFSKDINKPISEFWLHLHFSVENYITKDELKTTYSRFCSWNDNEQLIVRNSEIQEKVLEKTSSNIMMHLERNDIMHKHDDQINDDLILIITDVKK